ncbi:DHS-like NAD/FAD-binding domain-containing protein [Plectosphaerella plurivora]|uniref:DHS-like NAD/FAD-binding domain-containing protein n=1 Tax=Plectosphaerella plurivora TaxID=936078 RepID=A0A9P9A8M7_9PEZI|nr:DHS-like NAD/FAD-binding domain-containing protein [Plectosphaerella plurivora]
MGNEESRMFDGPPANLSSRSLEAVAEYINEGKAKRIAVMTGAGISTAAGIPDFRSPGTGLYANLARLNLPYAEAVFDIDFFRKRPEPFYYLAKELYPGKFHPTISHAFIALLARKELLHMLFTQNIDCLERRAGVPGDLVVEAHGSFATQRCIECKTPFPDADMKDHVEGEIVPRCEEKGCDGLVKPDIVFFGEALPERFRDKSPLAASADMIIVMGTSLTVYPFAGLPEYTQQGVPRVLLNNESVGKIGDRSDDVVEIGACDDSVRKLAALLGWEEELEALWREVVGDKEADRQLSQAKTGHHDVDEEVRKLTEEVEAALTLGPSDDGKEEPKVEEAKVSEAKAEEPSKEPRKATPDAAMAVPATAAPSTIEDAAPVSSSETPKGAATTAKDTTPPPVLEIPGKEMRQESDEGKPADTVTQPKLA